MLKVKFYLLFLIISVNLFAQDRYKKCITQDKITLCYKINKIDTDKYSIKIKKTNNSDSNIICYCYHGYWINNNTSRICNVIFDTTLLIRNVYDYHNQDVLLALDSMVNNHIFYPYYLLEPKESCTYEVVVNLFENLYKKIFFSEKFLKVDGRESLYFQDNYRGGIESRTIFEHYDFFNRSQTFLIPVNLTMKEDKSKKRYRYR